MEDATRTNRARGEDPKCAAEDDTNERLLEDVGNVFVRINRGEHQMNGRKGDQEARKLKTSTLRPIELLEARVDRK